MESELATHSSPGASEPAPSSAAARSHQATSMPAAAKDGAISQSCSTSWSTSQSDRASSRSATVSGSGADRRRPGLAPHAVQLDELLGP